MKIEINVEELTGITEWLEKKANDSQSHNQGLRTHISRLHRENKKLREDLEARAEPTVTNWERSQLEEENEKSMRAAMRQKMLKANSELKDGHGQKVWEAKVIGTTNRFESIIEDMSSVRQKAIDKIASDRHEYDHIMFCVSVELNSFNGELREHCIIERINPTAFESDPNVQQG